MPTKEMYKKYETNQSNPSGKLYYEHPSQEQINEMVAASHKPITSYEDLPESIKSKPGVDSSALTPNVSYLEAVGATQKPGDRKYGAQDD